VDRLAIEAIVVLARPAFGSAAGVRGHSKELETRQVAAPIQRLSSAWSPFVALG
jgi:hypothetical protein